MTTSLFSCPACGGVLTKEETLYRCEKGHSFDISAAGHVNLLPANKKNSKSPGDDADMVKAREIFLSAGYYEPLRESLFALVSELTENYDAVLTDIGCGEGYYTERLAQIPNIRVAAFDISKSAAVRAAKRLRCKQRTDAEVAVASAFGIPVRDGGADVVLNCFSPLALDEIRRVLSCGGYFLYVVPAAKHLWEMKSLIYDNPYENKELSPTYDGFEYLGKREVRDEIRLTSPEHISALFAMTPYFWHTPKKFADRLAAVTELKTKIEFDIHLYRKGKESI